MIRRLRNRRTTIPEESTEATASAEESASAEETASSEAATEETETTEATDSSEAATEQASTAEPDEAATETPESEATEESEAATPAVERGPSRLGFAWAACIAVALVLFAGGVGAGGYFALLRAHQQSQASARNSAAALEAAKICVAATQAPDTNAMAASEQKIIDCGTDVYRSQALLYTSMLVQAYQAANVHVQVSDERAAVERVNCDGSIDVLVALRVKVSNDQAKDQESGYRLRVTMAPADGQYKIAKLDQVTKPDQVTKKC